MQNRHLYRVITHERPKVYLILANSNFSSAHAKAQKFLAELSKQKGAKYSLKAVQHAGVIDAF